MEGAGLFVTTLLFAGLAAAADEAGKTSALPPSEFGDFGTKNLMGSSDLVKGYENA